MILLFWKQRGIRRSPTGEGVLVLTPGIFVFSDEHFKPFIPEVMEILDNIISSTELPTPMGTLDHLNVEDRVGMLEDQTRLLEK